MRLPPPAEFDSEKDRDQWIFDHWRRRTRPSRWRALWRTLVSLVRGYRQMREPWPRSRHDRLGRCVAAWRMASLARLFYKLSRR